MANHCENCGSNFSRSDNLKRHQNVCLLKTGVKRRKEMETHGENEAPEGEKEERFAILIDEINSLIDRFMDQNFTGTEEEIDQLKDDILQEICEHKELEEKEGGKLNFASKSWGNKDQKIEDKEEDFVEEKEFVDVEELKNRLHRYMKVFELEIADRMLTNDDILEYVKVLKIPKFRGVELPKEINPVECGIVKEEGRWVCYAKVYENRYYFDSFGQKITLEIELYMKTEEEIKDNTPVIDCSTNTLQRVDTNISGQLCLFVLTSMLREHLSFEKVIEQLKYAFAEHFY